MLLHESESVIVERVSVEGQSGVPGRPGYEEWDRSEWVGEGQEPSGAPLPTPGSQEPRWTKWEWIGENGNLPGPNRGAPPEAMPEGETSISGMRHNPGMAHWGGGRFGISRLT